MEIKGRTSKNGIRDGKNTEIRSFLAMMHLPQYFCRELNKGVNKVFASKIVRMEQCVATGWLSASWWETNQQCPIRKKNVGRGGGLK